MITESFSNAKTLIESCLNHRNLSYPICEVLMSVPIIISVLDEEGKTIFVNNALTPSTGYAPEELIGRNWWDVFFPGERYRQVETLQSYDENEAVNYETILTGKSGELVPIRWNALRINDSEGNLVMIFRFGLDITEQKQIEEAFRESEERFSLLTEMGKTGFITYGNNRILNANKAILTMFSYSLQELKEMGDIETLFTADSWPEIRKAIIENDNVSLEVEGLRKDGSVFPVEVCSKKIPMKKEIFSVITINDLSSVKESEKKLRQEREFYTSIIKHSPLGIVLYNREGRIFFANNQASEISGVPADKLLNRSYLDERWNFSDCHDIPIPSQDLIFNRVMETHKPVYDSCVGLLSPGGRRVYLSVNGTPLFDLKGDVDGVILAFNDITERVRTERELVDLKSKLETRANELSRSNTDLERFAFVAAHDLKEPLGVLLGFAHLLKERCSTCLETGSMKYVEYIIDEATLMQRLVSGLLQIARINSISRPFTGVDTGEVVTKIISNKERVIRETQVSITVDPLPIVFGDEVQLGEVFRNLIDNAIKYRKPKTPPMIHISAREENNSFLFSIQDNGIGIEPRYFGRIFQVFKRAPDGEVVSYGGTGIGLAICEKIINRHNGDIWVESEPGVGSTFFFTLPKPPETPQSLRV